MMARFCLDEREERSSFLKKRSKRLLYVWCGIRRGRALLTPVIKVFLLLFLQKKKSLLFLAALCWISPASAGGVVSLNLCTDQWLVRLAPEKVAAVTVLARDPSISVVAALAGDLPVVRNDAEAVLALHPDLVLMGAYGGQDVARILVAHGVRVVKIDDPSDFDGISRVIAQVAAVLGEVERGGKLDAVMRMNLGRIKVGTVKTAVMWQARGLSEGPGSLGDAVLRAAGYRNLGSGGSIGIERLLMLDPDLVVMDERSRFPSLATDMLSDPALARLRRVVGIDPAWLTCGGPEAAVAALRIAS